MTGRGGLTALAITAALLAGSCAQDANDSAEVIHASVQIDAHACGPDRGSGVVVAPDLVVTAAHTVAGSDQVDLTVHDGRVVVGRPVLIDTDLDVAVIRADGLDATPIGIADRNVRIASSTLLPLREEQARPTVLRRVVWADTTDIYRRVEVVKLVLELDIDIAPGDSGAGVLDPAGKLIGIVVSSSRGRPVAFAVHIEEIVPLIDAAMSRFDAPETECWK